MSTVPECMFCLPRGSHSLFFLPFSLSLSPSLSLVFLRPHHSSFVSSLFTVLPSSSIAGNFFSFQFCDVVTVAICNHHPQEERAKFDYMSERIVDIFTAMFWPLPRTQCLHMVTSMFFSSESVIFFFISFNFVMSQLKWQ